MTRRFIDQDGIAHNVADAAGLVAALHQSAITPSKSDEVFMQDMALRVELMTGNQCRYDSAENFVADLLAAGTVREI